MGVSNDMLIVITIVAIFVGIGVAIPYWNDEFDNSVTFDGSTGDVIPDPDNVSAVSGWQVFITVLSMFVWTIGGIPIWLNLVFTMLRILLVLVIARNVWIGGGG